MSDGWNIVDKKESSTWNYKEQPEMVGVYRGVEYNVGENAGTLFRFDDGTQEISVWGTTVLTDKLITIPVGDEVKIVYTGLKKAKRGNREYHDFDVYHRSLHDEEVDDITKALE